MDKSSFFTSLGGYLKANKAFFLSILFILLATGGYFWWQAGFTFEIGRFFASEGGSCTTDEDCDAGETCVSNVCESSGDPCAPTGDCGTGDCDGDGAINPVVYNGNDCDDGNKCVGGQASCRQLYCGNGTCESSDENSSNCPADCGGSPTYTCEDTSGQVCIGTSCSQAGMVGASGSCPSGENCCKPSGGGGTAPTNVTLSASPGTVAPGGTVTLTWSSSGATGCEVLAGNFGPIGTSGSATEAISTTTPSGTVVGFRIECSNTNGSTMSNVANVTVQGSPVYEHLECRNNTCTVIPEVGTNDPGCDTAGQSCTAPTHLGCSNQRCVQIPGQGSDLCTSDAQCVGTSSCPCGPGSWGSGGVTVCKVGGNIDTSQRCTQMGPNQNASVTVAICNNSGGNIYSKEALFFSSAQTCGAHADNPGHSTVSGDTSIDNGKVGTVTYSFNTGDCGSWQLDDTWRGAVQVFVVGQVINTGVNCSTPPPSIPPSVPPSVPPTVPPTTPPGALVCTPLNQTVGIGQTAILTASGGTPPYSWYAPNGTPSSGTAQGIAVTYAAAGNYSVALNDSGGNKESICYVTVTDTPTHLECNRETQACEQVQGAGTNQCATDADCRLTRALSCSTLSRQVNVGDPVEFTASGGTGTYDWSIPGGSTAADTNNPITVTYAAPGFKTVTVISGNNQAVCTVTVLEPVDVTHTTCSEQNACVTVPGPGTNQCSTDADCCVGDTCGNHTVCTEQRTCTTAIGPGTDQCATDADCAVTTHLECDGRQACVVVQGAGTNECTTDADCAVVSHGACNSENTCVIVPGPGNDQCTDNEDCNRTSHNVCNDQNACVSAPGPGADECADSTQCGQERHTVCATENFCMMVAGPGADECSSDADCGVVSNLVCSPATQSVRVNRDARFTVTGGTQRTFFWTAPDGTPASASGPDTTFAVRYRRAGTYTVTVRSGTDTDTCSVRVTSGGNGSYTHLECVNNTCARVNGQGTNECSTVGASCGNEPHLAIHKNVRNVTRNTAEENSTTASPTNTVEFSIQVLALGTGTLNNVTVRDALPAGLSYVAGSTTIDGVAASDGIVSTGLSLGSMPSGRTITIRFRATVASASFFSAGTTVLTNIAYARASNAAEVSDVAFVSVLQMPANATMSLTKTGRNVTRGETAEATVVRSSPAQTIEFILRVRNTSSKTLNNVMLRDILPPAITLVPGSVRIGTASASDSLTAAGLSLGTLAPGQEVVVKFSGLVAAASQLPSGTTTVINTANVSATGEPTIMAQLPIVITTGTQIPPIATGPGETTVLALIISAIITLLYVGYTSTDTYRRHEAGAIAREARGESSDFSK